MHTQTHRHCVAMSLLCLGFLLLIGLHSVFMARAALPQAAASQTLQSRSDTVSFSLTENFLFGQLDPYSVIAIPADEPVIELKRGSVLLHTNAVASVTIGSASIHLVSASVHVARNADGWVVVALDAPVMIDRDGQLQMMPAGYQMQVVDDVSHVPLPVPASWLAEKLGVLATLGQRSASPAADPAIVAALDAQDAPRALEWWATAKPTLSAGQKAAVLHELLSHTISQPQWVTLMTDVVGSIDSAEPLSRLVALQLAADPSIPAGIEQDLARLLTADTLDGSSAFCILAIANAAHPLAPAWIEQWSLLASHALSRDATATADLLSPLLIGLPSALEDRALPLQSRLWTKAANDFYALALPLLPDADRKTLAGVVAAARQPADEQLESAPAASAPIPSDNDTMALKQLLLEHGAMLTTTTSFSPQPGRIQVSGIFFSTAKGDEPFSFYYDPDHQLVYGIVRSGARLPNPLKIDLFLKSLGN